MLEWEIFDVVGEFFVQLSSYRDYHSKQVLDNLYCENSYTSRVSAVRYDS